MRLRDFTFFPSPQNVSHSLHDRLWFAVNQSEAAEITYRDNPTIRFCMYGGSLRPSNSSNVMRNLSMRSTRISIPSSVEDIVCMTNMLGHVGGSLPGAMPRSF